METMGRIPEKKISGRIRSIVFKIFHGRFYYGVTGRISEIIFERFYGIIPEEISKRLHGRFSEMMFWRIFLKESVFAHNSVCGRSRNL